VIPLKPRAKVPLTECGVKDATTDEASIRRWWKTWPDANIGVATGGTSGLLAVDVDEPSAWKAFVDGRELPRTPRQSTSGVRFQIIFKMPEGEDHGNAEGATPNGVNVRGTGGYICAAPSVHPTGPQYAWDEDLRPETTPLAEPPPWLWEAIKAQRFTGSGTPPTTDGAICEGERNVTLASIAGSMRCRGMSSEAIEAALLQENSRRCTRPLGENEVRRIAASISRYEPRSYPTTDLGNAERLVRLYGEDLRFCPLWRKWLIWDSKRWCVDELKAVELLSKETVRLIHAETTNESDEDGRKRLAAWAIRSESAMRIEAMLKLTQSHVAVHPDDFDRDPWLLCCENGVLDLRTGELREHRRDDLFTKIVPARYDPTAECPRWNAFLRRIFDNDAELTGYVQRAVGLSLIGEIRERVVFLCFGSGANGKSVFLETLMDVFGDYALSTPPETFLAKRHGAIPNDVARLRGARLVTSRETEEGKRLSASTVKALSGGDTISARFMRGEFFDFRPQCTVWVATNHLPQASAHDRALWDRLRIVPFKVRILEEEQDRDLRRKLEGERAGILRWAEDGCAEYLREGFREPAAVCSATDEYRREEDTLGRFIEDECILDSTARAPCRELFHAYREWCGDNEYRPLNERRFSQVLNEREFDKRRSGPGGGREWHGIGLVAPQHGPAPSGVE
jgi:putative DNA primase/helicase